MIKTKWIIYTVIIGLIPFILRLIIFILSKEKSWDFLANSIDFVFFGLALNLSNINEIENFNTSVDVQWATKFKGFSTIAIIVFASILGMLYISEQQSDPIISSFSAFIVAVLLGVTSFVISYAIFSKLNQLHNANS